MKSLKDYIKKYIKEQAYGSATMTTQGQGKSKYTLTGQPPGVWEGGVSNATAKSRMSKYMPDLSGGFGSGFTMGEITSTGGDFEIPEEEPGDMFQIKEVETILPNGMKSRGTFNDRIGKHYDWTKQSNQNNTFIHVQYHVINVKDDEYFIHQKQYSNHNYGDYRSPDYTMVYIIKNKETESQEILGKYLMNTDLYLQDMKLINDQGMVKSMVMEQAGEDKSYQRKLKHLQKGVLQFQLNYLQKKMNDARSQAAQAMSKSSEGFEKQIKALQDQIRALEKPPKKQQGQQNENVFAQYVNERINGNLMSYMDTYRRGVLIEGTMKKLFSLFNKGKTNEDILKHYARKGLTLPDTFLKKVRGQYESFKKLKLELDFSEQEAKDIITVPEVPDVALFDIPDLEEPQKKLTKRLSDPLKMPKLPSELEEGKTITRYDIPPEIRNALVDQLDMNPIVRYVQNLKAVNSIPPSYRIFLVNGQYFDIYYESFSLMAKIGHDEYFLANVEEKNYAKKHINRLLTAPVMSTGEEEAEEDDMGGDTGGGGAPTTTPPPTGGQTSPPPPDEEPEPEPEPEPEA